MNRRRKIFYGKAIVLKKQFMYMTVFICLFLVLTSNSINIITQTIKTDVYKSCISYSLPVLDIKRTKNILSITPINTVSYLLPVLKSNDDLNKKYATRYGFIKEKTGYEKVAESLIAENVLETDLSANGIVFSNPTNYTVSAEDLLLAPLSIKAPDNTPRVLIVHTHSSEAYANSPNARSESPEQNVIKVGETIAKELNRNGIITIHDTTRNDYPSYNGSYKKSLATVEKNLEKYPSIQIVLDIHRDYIERDKNQVKPTAIYDEGKAAQIMFVVGTDSMGLYHPDWRENLSLAVKLQNNLLEKRPNLCRAINMRTERFNHHTTKGSMIIEVGSSANTLDEALLSGKYIAQALCDILKNL
ncbi:MAG: stage II sporulation protein P [Clostridia bacterium]|nr:stage II sporulation protein P [Clostridia bacterium]